MSMQVLKFGGVVAVLLAASPAYAIDVCGLASRAEAAAGVGQPVAAAIPAGPQQDEDSPGRLSYCTYRAAKAGLIISVVEFSSAAEARKQATVHLVEAHSDGAKVVEEKGVGERTFWALSAQGASYTFLKGARVVAVAAGGVGQPAQRKDALRALASAVAKKL